MSSIEPIRDNPSRVYTRSIRDLVLALSALDRDVERGQANAPPSSRLQLAGRQLSQSILTDLGLGKTTSLSGLLCGSRTPKQCLVHRAGGSQPLREFLRDALDKAIKIVNIKEEQVHGAVYLYNWGTDELVMSASQGFPLRKLRKWYKPFTIWLKEHDDEIKDALKSETQPSDDFRRNILRLHHIHHVLQPMVANATIARDPWVREELRAYYPKIRMDINGLDCNEDLVGVAYYKLGGTGITVQLFDREDGPKLERPEFDARFIRLFGDEARMMVPDMTSHMLDKVLRQRTVAYRARDQMAAGRSVKAGVYEGLQFPHSAFIGPFLGTVLRFNGEHLGILKVEKHQFSYKLDKSKAHPTDLFSPWRTGAEGFSGKETFYFLMFAYALSGILYLLKHHAGMELSNGWTTAPLGKEVKK